MCFLPVHENVVSIKVLALAANRKYLAIGEVVQDDHHQVGSLVLSGDGF